MQALVFMRVIQLLHRTTSRKVARLAAIYAVVGYPTRCLPVTAYTCGYPASPAVPQPVSTQIARRYRRFPTA